MHADRNPLSHVVRSLRFPRAPPPFVLSHLVKLKLDSCGDRSLQVLLPAAPSLTNLNLTVSSGELERITTQRFPSLVFLTCRYHLVPGDVNCVFLERLVSLTSSFPALIELDISIETHPMFVVFAKPPVVPSFKASTTFLRALPSSIKSLRLNGITFKSVVLALGPLISASPRIFLPLMMDLAAVWDPISLTEATECVALIEACQTAGVRMGGTLAEIAGRDLNIR
ncbi:hypothetical protein P7C70_g3395, partial [Phenoliferia sp. Uapishka_3]